MEKIGMRFCGLAEYFGMQMVRYILDAASFRASNPAPGSAMIGERAP
jgi:hypothetical protein